VDIVRDIRRQIEANENWLEELIRSVPGFSGYKERENRREADKILRHQLATDLEDQLRQLDKVKLNLTNQGELEQLDELDRLGRKVGTLINEIRYADYGFTGFFDALKIDEADLDRLYEYDASLAAQMRNLGEGITALSQTTRENLLALLAEIEAKVEELQDKWSQREQVMQAVRKEEG